MRYFLHIGYDGTDFSGWQRQKNTPLTIQEQIEKVLSQNLKKTIVVHGCGRTDAGVHASQYFLQFDADQLNENELQFRLNKNLPDTIVVYDILKVDDKKNCQHDAIKRTYDYFIHWKKDPVLMGYSSFYDDVNLDIDLMKEAAVLISNTRDFRTMCKQPDLYDNTMCQISDCSIYSDEDQGRMRISITSNRFLRGMVRICVQYLIKVGNGDLTVGEFADILKDHNNSEEKQPAFPNGLYLSNVVYPYIELKNKHLLFRMMKDGLG